MLACSCHMFCCSFHNGIKKVNLMILMQLSFCSSHLGMLDNMLFHHFLWMRCTHWQRRINLFFIFNYGSQFVANFSSFQQLVSPYLIFCHQNHYRFHQLLVSVCLYFRDYRTIFLAQKLFELLASILNRYLHADLKICHHILPLEYFWQR